MIKCGICYQEQKVTLSGVEEGHRLRDSLILAQGADFIYLGKGYCQDHYEKAVAHADSLIPRST